MCVVTNIYMQCGCSLKSDFSLCDAYKALWVQDWGHELENPSLQSTCIPQCSFTAAHKYLAFGHPPALTEDCLRQRQKAAERQAKEEISRVVDGRNAETATVEIWQSEIIDILYERSVQIAEEQETGEGDTINSPRQTVKMEFYRLMEGQDAEELWEKHILEIRDERATDIMQEHEKGIRTMERQQRQRIGGPPGF